MGRVFGLFYAPMLTVLNTYSQRTMCRGKTYKTNDENDQKSVAMIFKLQNIYIIVGISILAGSQVFTPILVRIFFPRYMSYNFSYLIHLNLWLHVLSIFSYYFEPLYFSMANADELSATSGAFFAFDFAIRVLKLLFAVMFPLVEANFIISTLRCILTAFIT